MRFVAEQSHEQLRDQLIELRSLGGGQRAERRTDRTMSLGEDAIALAPPPGGQDESHGAPVCSRRSPLRHAVRFESIDEPHRAGVRQSERSPQLLDGYAGQVADEHHRGRSGAGFAGLALRRRPDLI